MLCMAAAPRGCHCSGDFPKQSERQVLHAAQATKDTPKMKIKMQSQMVPSGFVNSLVCDVQNCRVDFLPGAKVEDVV